jgi:hypothetical protein
VRPSHDAHARRLRTIHSKIERTDKQQAVAVRSAGDARMPKNGKKSSRNEMKIKESKKHLLVVKAFSQRPSSTKRLSV